MSTAIIGPTTQTIPGSWPLFVTETSGFPSTGIFGFGRLGGSPGGTSLMSSDKYSENGDDVYRCWLINVNSISQVYLIFGNKELVVGTKGQRRCFFFDES